MLLIEAKLLAIIVRRLLIRTKLKSSVLENIAALKYILKFEYKTHALVLHLSLNFAS